MLVRDLRTGRLIAVPDNQVFASPLGGDHFGSYAPGGVHGLGSVPGLGHYGAAPQQIMYDGLGHPLGLPFLAALPFIGKVAAFLPQVASVASKVLPFLQGTGAMPQGQPAQMQAPDKMAPPSMQPPMQPSMPLPVQPFMQTPMQSPIEPPMQESMFPPTDASAQSAMPPSVRFRRHRRVRGGQFVRIQPAIPRRQLSPGGYVPGPGAPSPYLQGWFGFNGWRGY